MPDLKNHKKQQPTGPGITDGGLNLELIGPALEQVRQRIENLLSIPDEDMQQYLHYMVSSKGKMIRPALVLLTGACFGPTGSGHIDLAAIVELIHRASLLHDDVIDMAKTRRTRQTANALWGNTTAVLLGDFLLSRAFSLDIIVQMDQVQQILSQTAQHICCGELKQNFHKGHWDISLQDYYQIIESKTAALFESSCRLGAIASQVAPEQVEAVRQFGRYLGIAFQVSDDLLDIVGNSDTVGKTLGTDLKQGKLTLAVILWIGQDTAQKPARIALLEEGMDRQALVRELTESGSLNKAMSLMQELLLQAKASLKNLGDCPAKQSLLSMVDYVGGRIRTS